MADGSDDVVTLNLYNLTDVHGHIEPYVKNGKVIQSGLEAVGCYLKNARSKENVGFTLLGDNIGATPFVSANEYDNPTIAALNALKPIASTMGNHELDLGQQVFKDRVDGKVAIIDGKKVQMTKIGFPYMVANVTGELKTEGYLKDYEVRTIGGVKVAYIGAVGEDTPTKLLPHLADGMVFSDPVAKIKEIATKLKADNEADVVIAMLDDDVKANINKFDKNGPVDGLMGGDTHVPYFFDKGTMVDGEPAHITGTASGAYTDNLSNLQVKYNKTTHKVVSVKAIRIPASEVAECKDDAYGIKAIVEQAEAAAAKKKSEVVGVNMKHAFYRGATADMGPHGNIGTESTVGDLVADAFQAGIKTDKGKPVDIGVVNAGGLRTNLIPKDGKLTYGDAFNVMPFGNKVGYVEMTGADFKRALEEQWKQNTNDKGPQFFNGAMQRMGISSNVRYTFDPTKPAGHHITSITVNGAPIDMGKTYTVGSVSFLLGGGDTYDIFGYKDDIKRTIPRPVHWNPGKDLDYFVKYLTDHPGIKPQTSRHSIGVFGYDPEKVYNLGDTVNIKLQGLSFTEKAAYPDGVDYSHVATVGLGGAKYTTKVNNNMTEPEYKDFSKAILRRDGAGQAAVTVKLDKALCAGHSGQTALPLTVSTDTGGLLVANANGLNVKVSCPIVKQSDTGKTGGQHGAKNASHLAKTGSDANNVGLLALALLLMGGAVTVAVRIRKLS